MYSISVSVYLNYLVDLFFCFFIFLNTYQAVKIFKFHKFCTWPHHEKRQSFATTVSVVTSYVLITFVLIALIVSGRLPAATLGFREWVNPVLAFAIGFAVNALWQWSYRIYWERFAMMNSTVNNYRAFRMLLPRKRFEKYLLILTVVLLNPFYEEVIFRGILVHRWGQLIGNVWVTGLIGYGVFITLHLYQGISVVFQHTLNYAFFVLLLFSPLGLIGAIGFHFGGDLFPMIWAKEVIKEYRTMYRNKLMNERC